jgi:hypothetical protein
MLDDSANGLGAFVASVLSLPTHNTRSIMPRMVDTVYRLIRLSERLPLARSSDDLDGDDCVSVGRPCMDRPPARLPTVARSVARPVALSDRAGNRVAIIDEGDPVSVQGRSR